MAEWTRSAAIEYGTTWNLFEMLNPTTNQMQLFWIMDLPEHLYEYVVWTLAQLTFETTPIELRSAVLNDQVSLAERQLGWRKALGQRLSLICLTKYPDGIIAIAAVDIIARRSINDREPEFKGKLSKWRWSIQKYIYGKRPYYNDFGVSEVIIGVGGFIMPEFSVTSVPEEMLNCRGMLCKATGIKLSIGNFIIQEGQDNMHSAADKAGYVDYVRVPYKELASIFRTYWLPKCEFFRLMFHLYDVD